MSFSDANAADTRQLSEASTQLTAQTLEAHLRLRKELELRLDIATWTMISEAKQLPSDSALFQFDITKVKRKFDDWYSFLPVPNESSLLKLIYIAKHGMDYGYKMLNIRSIVPTASSARMINKLLLKLSGNDTGSSTSSDSNNISFMGTDNSSSIYGKSSTKNLGRKSTMGESSLSIGSTTVLDKTTVNIDKEHHLFDDIYVKMR
jgi:hypothetical protein